MSGGGGSGARFVWPLARAWVLEYTSSAYSGAVGSRGSEWGAYKVSQGAKPVNCQGREFLLGLMVGEPAFWCQAGRRGDSQLPSLRFLGLKLSPPFLHDPGPLTSHSPLHLGLWQGSTSQEECREEGAHLVARKV